MRSRPATPLPAETGAEPEIEGLMVAEVLGRWPSTVPVFVRYRLACVGCLMARFELLADVPRIYGLDPQEFLREVQQAVYLQETARCESPTH